MKTIRKVQLLSVLFGITAISLLGASQSFALEDSEFNHLEFEEKMEELDDKYKQLHEEFGFVEPELTEEQWAELEQRLEEIDLESEQIHRQYGFMMDFSESEQIEFDMQLEELHHNEMQIYEQFGVFDEEDYDSLTQEKRNAFDRAIEDIEAQYDELNERFGFVEPELTEEQHMEFEEKMEEIHLRYEQVHSEFGFVEPELSSEQQEEFEARIFELDEEFERIHEEFGIPMWEFEECPDCDDEFERHDNATIAELESKIEEKDRRIAELEQQVDSLENQAEDLKQIISEQLSVIYDWVVNR